MNRFENWFCASSIWKYATRRRLLPWLLADTDLGEHVLELGAGFGATTGELRGRARRVTSLEYDHRFVAELHARFPDGNGHALQGDAAALPFADKTFSSALAVLVLHHLRDVEQQEKTLGEVYRVLRPGGTFLAFEIPDGWFNRVLHTKSTFVPVAPGSAVAQLRAAGFAKVSTDLRPGGFRIRAVRALEA